MKYKLISASICLAIIILQPMNKFIESFFHFGYAKASFVEISMPLNYETEEPQITTEPVVETLPDKPTFDLSDVAIGQDVAGYKITSLQGPRSSPCNGCSSYHNGLDLGTPSGTPLYAPGTIEVVCKVDSGGGGSYAEFQYADMRWQTLHLTPGTCKPGGYEKGWKFAETGSSGRGSGPHLHLQLRMADNSFIKVKKGHLESIMTQQGG